MTGEVCLVPECLTGQGCVWSWGMPGQRRVSDHRAGGGCVWSEGVDGGPPSAVGMHPTGMHFFIWIFLTSQAVFTSSVSGSVDVQKDNYTLLLYYSA